MLLLLWGWRNRTYCSKRGLTLMKNNEKNYGNGKYDPRPDPTRENRLESDPWPDPTQPDPARSADGPDPCPSLCVRACVCVQNHRQNVSSSPVLTATLRSYMGKAKIRPSIKTHEHIFNEIWLRWLRPRNMPPNQINFDDNRVSGGFCLAVNACIKL